MLPGALLASVVSAGGSEPVDPLTVLRQDPQVQWLRPVSVSAGARVVTVQTRAPAVQVDVLFSNEAQRPSQASQVRLIEMGVQVSPDHGLSLAQAQALSFLFAKMTQACLGQPAPMLTDLLRSRINHVPLDPGTVQSFPGGLSLAVVRSGTPEHPAVVVQATGRLGDALPRCRMPR